MKFFLMISLFSSLVWAGQERGGGNAIVCFDDPAIPSRMRHLKASGIPPWIDDKDISHITKVEILDLLEARLYREQPQAAWAIPRALVSSLPNETAVQFIERVRGRLQVLAPGIAERIQKAEKSLSTFKEFPHGMDAIDDVGPRMKVDSSLCVVATIIGQFRRGAEQFIGYDSRIFDLPEHIHSTLSKNVSLLHEYAYYISRAEGTDGGVSETARYFVSTLLRQDLSLDDVLIAYRNMTRPSSFWYTSYLRNLYERIDAGTRPIFEKARSARPDNISKEKFKKACEVKAQSLSSEMIKWYKAEGSDTVLGYPRIPDELKQDIWNLMLQYPENIYTGTQNDWDTCYFQLPFFGEYTQVDLDRKFFEIKLPSM